MLLLISEAVLFTSNFSNKLLRWLFTVVTLINSFSAIAGLVIPTTKKPLQSCKGFGIIVNVV